MSEYEAELWKVCHGIIPRACSWLLFSGWEVPCCFHGRVCRKDLRFPVNPFDTVCELESTIVYEGPGWKLREGRDTKSLKARLQGFQQNPLFFSKEVFLELQNYMVFPKVSMSYLSLTAFCLFFYFLCRTLTSQSRCPAKVNKYVYGFVLHQLFLWEMLHGEEFHNNLNW